MPVVTMESELRVRPEALRPGSMRVDVRGTTGEAIAEGLGQVARTVAQVGNKYEEERAAAEVGELERKLSEKELQRTLAEKDPEDPEGKPGLYRRHGKDAADAALPTLEKLEKDREELAKSAKSARARELFLRRTQGWMDRTREKVNVYQIEQNRAYLKDEANKTVKAASDAVFLDPDKLEDWKLRGAWVAKAAQEHGTDPAEALREYHAALTEAALRGMIARQDVAGAGRFLADPDVKNLLGQRSEKYEPILVKQREGIQIEQEATKILDAALGAPGVGGKRWVDKEKARAAAEALPDTSPIQDEVRALVFRRLAQDEAVQQSEGSDRYQRILARIHGGVPLTDKANAEDAAYLLDAKNGSVTMYDRLVEHDRARLRRARGADLPPSRSDRVALGNLMAHLNVSPELYARTPPGKLEDRMVELGLAPKGFRFHEDFHLRAMGLLAESQGKLREPVNELPAGHRKRLIQALAGAKIINPKLAAKPGSEDGAVLLYWTDRARDDYNLARKNGGDLPDNYFSELAKNGAVPVKVRGSGIIFDDTEPAARYEAKEATGRAEEGTTPEIVIPESAKEAIREELAAQAARGKDVGTSDEWVNWLYWAKRGVDVPRPPPLTDDEKQAAKYREEVSNGVGY